jgi:hypothetical protein
MTRGKNHWIVGLLLGTLSCSSPGESSSPCKVATEGCACSDGGACDGDLACLSGICVARDKDSDQGTANGAGAAGTEATTEGGQAVAKFCHDLMYEGEVTTVTLFVGTAPDEVGMATATGNCSTVLGATCTAISSGTHPVRLVHQGTTLWTGTASNIAAGDEWLFTATVESGTPEVSGGKLKSSYACSTVNPFTTVDPDGSSIVSSGSGSTQNECSACIAGCQGLASCCTGSGCICQDECLPPIPTCTGGKSLRCDSSGFCLCM